VGRRRAQLEESAARYLAQLGTANRAGTVRRAGGQDGPTEGQIGQAGKRDAASGGDGKADAGPTRGRVSTPEAHRYVAFEPKAILSARSIRPRFRYTQRYLGPMNHSLEGNPG
jgi:hypothetical protein